MEENIIIKITPNNKEYICTFKVKRNQYYKEYCFIKTTIDGREKNAKGSAIIAPPFHEERKLAFDVLIQKVWNKRITPRKQYCFRLLATKKCLYFDDGHHSGSGRTYEMTATKIGSGPYTKEDVILVLNEFWFWHYRRKELKDIINNSVTPDLVKNNDIYDFYRRLKADGLFVLNIRDKYKAFKERKLEHTIKELFENSGIDRFTSISSDDGETFYVERVKDVSERHDENYNRVRTIAVMKNLFIKEEGNRIYLEAPNGK